MLEEEKEAAEKLAAEKEDQKTIGESDVETPRSDAARNLFRLAVTRNIGRVDRRAFVGSVATFVLR